MWQLGREKYTWWWPFMAETCSVEGEKTNNYKQINCCIHDGIWIITYRRDEYRPCFTLYFIQMPLSFVIPLNEELKWLENLLHIQKALGSIYGTKSVCHDLGSYWFSLDLQTTCHESITNYATTVWFHLLGICYTIIILLCRIIWFEFLTVSLSRS